LAKEKRAEETPFPEGRGNPNPSGKGGGMGDLVASKAIKTNDIMETEKKEEIHHLHLSQRREM